MSFIDKDGNLAQVTLYAIVKYDWDDSHPDKHTVVGVQTNPVPLECSESPNAPVDWEFGSVVGGVLPDACFRAARADPSGKFGNLSLNFVPNTNATPFVNDQTIKVTILVPTKGLHELTVNLRAISARKILSFSTGTAVLGSGGDVTAGRLAASHRPNSTATDDLPVWDKLFWHPLDTGGSFTPNDELLTQVVGDPGDFRFELRDAEGNMRALFDNAAVTPGLDFGESALEIVECGVATEIDFPGLPIQVGIAPNGQAMVHFQIVAVQDCFFSLNTVRIRIDFHERYGVNRTARFVHQNGVLVQNLPDPDGVTIDEQQPTVAVGDRPQVRPGLTLYPGAAHSTKRATWGDGTEAGNFRVTLDDGRYNSFTIRVVVKDHCGRKKAKTSKVYVHLPTDVVLALDYSESMSSTPAGDPPTKFDPSRWALARDAANRFHAVYQALAPALGAGAALAHRIGLVRYFWDDPTDTDQTEFDVPLTDVGAVPVGNLVVVGDPPGANRTPIARGVLKAHEKLGGGDWRRRVIVVMSDGLENRGPTISDIRLATEGDLFIPNSTDSAQDGIIIHACAFGPATTAEDDQLEYLATGADGTKGYGGTFHAPVAAIPPDGGKSLTNAFLDVLVDTVPGVNKLPYGDVLSHTLTIEPGVGRAVILISSDAGGTLRGPSAGTAVEAAGAGIRWWTIDDPIAGSYSVQMTSTPAAGAVDLHGLVDLRLRAEFAVEGDPAVGETLKLTARISDAGRPVSGACAQVHVSGPCMSQGLLLEQLARVSEAERGRVPSYIEQADARNPRTTLLRAAEERLGIRPANNVARFPVLELEEAHDEPGTYVAFFTRTTHEGTYNFEFTAHGRMVGGGEFARGYAVSRYLRPALDPDLTSAAAKWITTFFNDEVAVYKLVVTPTTRSGAPLGGGKSLTVELDGETRTLVDALDGTYTLQIVQDREQMLPTVTLSDGVKPIPVEPKIIDKRVKQVRVILEQIRIIDAHETYTDPGEIAFDVVISPGAGKESAVRRRLPRLGWLELHDNEVAQLNAVIFDEPIADGTPLLISIGGTEHDAFPSGDTRTESLGKYRRVLSGPVVKWSGRYVPGDEKLDGEELADWKLWYRIEVE